MRSGNEERRCRMEMRNGDVEWRCEMEMENGDAEMWDGDETRKCEMENGDVVVWGCFVGIFSNCYSYSHGICVAYWVVS